MMKFRENSDVFQFDNVGNNVMVEVAGRDHFEKTTGCNVGEISRSLVNDVDDSINWIHILQHDLGDDLYDVSLNKGSEDPYEGAFHVLELYFQRTPRMAFFSNFFPRSKIQGQGSLHLKNIFQVLQQIGIQHIRLMADSDMSPYYFARLGGRPVDNWASDTCGEEKCPKIKERIADILAKHWNDVSGDTRDKVRTSLEKIEPDYFDKNPTFLSEFAAARDNIEGQPLGFHFFNNSNKEATQHYLFDLESEKVMSHALSYLDSKIALIPQGLQRQV